MFFIPRLGPKVGSDLMIERQDLVLTSTGFKNYSSYASRYKNGACVSDLETSIGLIHLEHG